MAALKHSKNWVALLAVCGAMAGSLLAQDPNADPRTLSMAGAMVSLAEGIHAVGYNPARLAYSSKDYSMNLGGLTFGALNNMLSVKNYNLMNGADLLDPISADYVAKEDFLNLIPDVGWRLNTNLHLPMPGINWARGTTAFSSEVVVYADIGLPKAYMTLMMDGNPIGETLNLDLAEEAIGVVEWGFSFAIPTESMAFGATIKYLQGLFYLGIDPDSSYGTFSTDLTGFAGDGRYLIRQAVGGGGIGLDLGFATAEFNGYQVGVSLINAIGAIRWQGPSLTKDLLGDGLQGLMPWGENEYFVISYEVNDVTATDIQSGSLDSLFLSESYTVFESADSGLVRSKGRDVADFEPKEFVTNYPATFRMGISKKVPAVGLFSLELKTNFSDQLWASRKWQLAFGAELWGSPTFPLRVGLMYGGRETQQLGIGFGVHTGPINFDFGLALHNGYWIHTAKGISLAFGFTWVK